jgi:hypothetical protein
MRASLPILLVFFLSACVSSTPHAASNPQSYLWLAQPGVTDGEARTRYRAQFDAVLREHGYVQSANPALALSIATDAPLRRERDLGYGVYSGGYPYFTPDAAPAGYVEVHAFDIETLRPVWSARWPATSADAGGATFDTANSHSLSVPLGGEAHDPHR